MKFYAISNPGVAALDTLITFGVSSSRGNVEKIGQFGSGFKFGILCLLRAGYDFTLMLGRDCVRFWSEFTHTKNTSYNKVVYSINGGNPQAWPVALEFGAINWTNTDMALREFVSNAIDNTEDGKFSIRVVDSIATTPGHTTIYIQDVPAIRQYFNNIKTNFLHFEGNERKNILPNLDNSDVRFYRKGVFVRSLSHKSLFHYNGELTIDECRNSDPYYCNCMKAELLQAAIVNCNEEIITPLFDAMDKGLGLLEVEGENIGQYFSSSVKQCEQLRKWFVAKYPNRLLTFKSHRADTLMLMLERGVSPFKVSERWYQWLSKFLPKVEDMDGMADGDTTFLDPSPEVLEVFRKVSQAFSDMGWKKKEEPIVKMFRPSPGGALKLGLCKGNIVAMNADQISYATAIEELLHYHYGVADMTRQFQECSMRMLGDMLKILY